jgi:uncharacterized membrane protein
MATFVVCTFPTAEGADTMLSTLEGLHKQQLIQIQDGAIVTWPAGASKLYLHSVKNKERADVFST